MSAPKVSQTTDDKSLAGRRDAFHVPGILVSCVTKVNAGEGVCFVDEALSVVRLASREERQAIVDPFAPVTINSGVLFWVFLMPDLVTNLVHHFDVSSIRPAPLDDTSDDDDCAACYSPSDEMDDDDDYYCKGCYE